MDLLGASGGYFKFLLPVNLGRTFQKSTLVTFLAST